MNAEFYYSTRRGWPGWVDVVLCSAHTGDAKETVSSHRNAHNARQRSDKLNREANLMRAARDGTA